MTEAEALKFREGWDDMMRRLEDARACGGEGFARLCAESILTNDRVVSCFSYGRSEACAQFLNESKKRQS